MLQACAVRFDVTFWVEFFLGTKTVSNAAPQTHICVPNGVLGTGIGLQPMTNTQDAICVRGERRRKVASSSTRDANCRRCPSLALVSPARRRRRRSWGPSPRRRRRSCATGSRGGPPPARRGEEERVAGEGGRAEEGACRRGGRRAELGGEGGQGARPAWIRSPARRSGRLLVGSARRAELEVERREGALDPPEGERRERRPAS